MVAVQRWDANVQHIVFTERIAQAGIALVRNELSEAQIDERVDLSPTAVPGKVEPGDRRQKGV